MNRITAVALLHLGWHLAPATFAHAGYGWIRSAATQVTIEHRV